MYKSQTAICEGVVRPGIDYVYARSKLGDQRTIAQLLNENIKDLDTITDNPCVKKVFRALCNFYLPPCGNATHPTPPTSICQRECQMVHQKCWRTWDAVMLALKTIHPRLNCNDTSCFPVPHCCSEAGLRIVLALINVHKECVWYD